ncbi:MAG: flagellar protein FlgN [Thiobacillaceae bacterium]|nr:flagellar protein FlgN [Thiobacillaceae bacterium]
MSPLDQNLAGLTRELEAFLALLEEEAIALAAGNSDRLSELVSQRQGASLRLAGHWKDLAGLLQLPPQAGFAALRDKAMAGAAPSPPWRLLESLTREAARLNQVNGRLIEEQMRRNQAAMRVLQSAVASRGLYGADGRVSDLPNLKRSIDSA